jgi:hypothetical protein
MQHAGANSKVMAQTLGTSRTSPSACCLHNQREAHEGQAPLRQRNDRAAESHISEQSHVPCSRQHALREHGCAQLHVERVARSLRRAQDAASTRSGRGRGRHGKGTRGSQSMNTHSSPRQQALYAGQSSFRLVVHKKHAAGCGRSERRTKDCTGQGDGRSGCFVSCVRLRSARYQMELQGASQQYKI